MMGRSCSSKGAAASRNASRWRNVIARTLTTSESSNLGATSIHVEKECHVDCREQVLLYIVSSKHSCFGRQLGTPYSAQSPSRRFMEQRVNWDTATDKTLHYLCVLHRDETMQQHIASPLLRLIWDKDHPQRACVSWEPVQNPRMDIVQYIVFARKQDNGDSNASSTWEQVKAEYYKDWPKQHHARIDRAEQDCEVVVLAFPQPDYKGETAASACSSSWISKRCVVPGSHTMLQQASQKGKRKRGPQRNIGWAYVDEETGAGISPETVEATATAISETPTAAATAAAAAANTTDAAITTDADSAAAAAPASQRSDLAQDTSYDSDKTESDVNDDDFEEIYSIANNNTDSDNDSDYDCNRQATPTATVKQELVAASSSSSNISSASGGASGGASSSTQKHKQHRQSKAKAKARETTNTANSAAPKQSAAASAPASAPAAASAASAPAAVAVVKAAAAAPVQHVGNDAFDSGIKCVLCNDQPAEVMQVHADGSVHVTVCTEHVAIVTGTGYFTDKCALATSGCSKRVIAAFCLQPLAHNKSTADTDDDVHCEKYCVLCNKRPATI
eukprot:4646-Heterococcus_DN1.PRE.2